MAKWWFHGDSKHVVFLIHSGLQGILRDQWLDSPKGISRKLDFKHQNEIGITDCRWPTNNSNCSNNHHHHQQQQKQQQHHHHHHHHHLYYRCSSMFIVITDVFTAMATCRLQPNISSYMFFGVCTTTNRYITPLLVLKTHNNHWALLPRYGWSEAKVPFQNNNKQSNQNPLVSGMASQIEQMVDLGVRDYPIIGICLAIGLYHTWNVIFLLPILIIILHYNCLSVVP